MLLQPLGQALSTQRGITRSWETALASSSATDATLINPGASHPSCLPQPRSHSRRVTGSPFRAVALLRSRAPTN